MTVMIQNDRHFFPYDTLQTQKFRINDSVAVGHSSKPTLQVQVTQVGEIQLGIVLKMPLAEGVNDDNYRLIDLHLFTDAILSSLYNKYDATELITITDDSPESVAISHWYREQEGQGVPNFKLICTWNAELAYKGLDESSGRHDYAIQVEYRKAKMDVPESS